MGAALTTEVLKLPQWEGNEYFQRLDMNDAFKSIEEAVRQYDYLANRYGYEYTKTESDGNTVFTETVAEGCPVTAKRVTTKSEVDGVKQFVTVVTIADKSITLTETKTETGWKGVVN